MNSRKRYVILTPFDRPDILAAILKLRGIEADVAYSRSGALVVHEIADPQFDDWDIAELLGFDDGVAEAVHSQSLTDEEPSINVHTDENNMHDEMNLGNGSSHAAVRENDDAGAMNSVQPEYAAQELSKLTPYGVIFFRADLGDDVGGEDGVSGLIHAQRYVNGQPGEEISAGLLLGGLDDVVEELVLGIKDIDVLTRIIHPSDVDESFLAQLAQSMHEE